MRRVRAVGIFLIAWLTCPTFAAAQSQQGSTVRLDVLVRDGKRLVRGLSAADFEITDAGVPQRILGVTAGRSPVNVILVLDSEANVRDSWLKYSVAAARAVVAALQPGDRVGLVAVSASGRTLMPLTTERQQIHRALDSLQPGVPPAFGEAVVAALEMAEGAAGRTLMIVAGTPDSTMRLAASDELRRAVALHGVVVYAVGKILAYDRTIFEAYQKGSRTPYPGEHVPVGFDHGVASGPAVRVEMKQLFLESMAVTSGGRAMTSRPAEFRKLFLAALEEFRARYVVSYEPTGVPPDGWHRVEVRLKGKRRTITARPGYFVQ